MLPLSSVFNHHLSIFNKKNTSPIDMRHEMHLDPIPFDEIYSGLKKIESRLNDAKRQKICVGDVITFYERPECIRKIEVQVIGLHNYTTIKELVEATPLEYWGPRFQSKQQLVDAAWHYDEKKITQYGLLAIEITRLQ
jgi:ASC-1-like (ASCH) protein